MEESEEEIFRHSKYLSKVISWWIRQLSDTV